MPKKDNVRTVEQLAELFDLPEWDDIHERNWEYWADRGTYAYDSALEDGDNEEEAEAAREEAEQEAEQEVFSQWHNGVVSAAERIFEEHKLKLVPVDTHKYPWEYKVEPEIAGAKGWRAAAEELLETLNGVGHFYFSSLDDFLDSGPYTPREAVLSHLAYMSYWPEIYGAHSARAIYEWSWR